MCVGNSEVIHNRVLSGSAVIHSESLESIRNTSCIGSQGCVVTLIALVKFRVFRLGLLEDRDIHVCGLPE
jgi:hypothetical protein